MTRLRPRCTALALAAVLAVLAAPRGHAESWADSLQIKPTAAPIDLRYRPVSRVTIVFGLVVIEQVGVRQAVPIERSTDTMRIAAVGDKLAVTLEPGEDAPGRASDAAPRLPMLRLLMSAKGELLDAVAIDENGTPEERDGPFLAELEQSLSFVLPRYPDGPVSTGDTVYDHVTDVGYDLGLGSGQMPLHVVGTVRGTASVNGRECVVIDFRSDGRCKCGPITLTEQGYELIDIATGVVLAMTATARLQGPDGFVRWTTGVEARFQ